MKIFLGILAFIFLFSCQNPNKKINQNIQKDLFGTELDYSEIKSIDIVEIEHPMIGGIISSKTLTEIQKELFIKKLKMLELDGMYKCGSKYVVRLNLSKDTIRLKICGEKISNRHSDIYYCLPNNAKMISDIIVD